MIPARRRNGRGFPGAQKTQTDRMVRIADESLQVHFPVHVLVREHEGVDEINHPLAELIRRLDDELRLGPDNAATNGSSTTQGGFQSPAAMNFLDRPEPAVRALRQLVVMPAIEHYLAAVHQVNPLLARFQVRAWCNRLGKGNWQAPHLHPTEFTIISGVYYVHCPALAPPAGCLEFINPTPISVMLGGQAATRLHVPQTGQIVLFPPHYMHFVHPLDRDIERIVVAFDVRLQAPEH